MTEEAKKRCEELGWKSWPNLWAHASQRLAFEEGYKVGMQDPDAFKGWTAEMKIEHGPLSEVKDNENLRRLLDECENVLLQAWGELEAGCKASEMCFELIDKLKAARV